MKFNDTLLQAVKVAVSVGLTPALIGESGIGKSSFVEDLARQMSTRAFVLPCNSLATKEDLTGARLISYVKADGSTGYKQEFFPHHIVQEACDYANANPNEFPFLFLDEINRANSDVTSGILTMETLRRLGTTHLPKNLRLFIAGNNKGNITALDEASISRFALFHVEPDAATFLALMGAECNTHVRKVLTAHPEMIFMRSTSSGAVADGVDDDSDDATTSFNMLFESGEEMLQITTPRTIERLSKWLNAMDQQALGVHLATPTVIGGIDDRNQRTETVLRELIEGMTGNTEFTDKIIGSIAEDISNGTTSNAPTRQVTRPAIYDRISTVGTMSDLDAIITTMSQRDLSGCLLFALYEKKDNARMIEHLAASLDQMETEHSTEMGQLGFGGHLDRNNLDALIGSNTPVAESLSQLLALL